MNREQFRIEHERLRLARRFAAPNGGDDWQAYRRDGGLCYSSSAYTHAATCAGKLADGCRRTMSQRRDLLEYARTSGPLPLPH